MPSIICNVCGSVNVRNLFAYYSLKFPLTTQSWPKSHEEAISVKKYPVCLYRCMECDHVFNGAFTGKIPYDTKPDFTYNLSKSSLKLEFEGLQAVSEMLESASTIVEIGHGDGRFLSLLGQLRPDSRFYGFDTCGEESSNLENVTFHRQLFSSEFFEENRVDCIIMRQVIEHFSEPVKALQEILPSKFNNEVKFFFEVPCVDNALNEGRIEDFNYEHVSHFTLSSFTKFLQKIDAECESIQLVSSKNILRAFGSFSPVSKFDKSEKLFEKFILNRDEIRKQILGIRNRAALWGVTGRGAVLAILFGLSNTEFPIAIDSDERKAGSYVPSTGQLILSPQEVNFGNIDSIIILPSWRAQDIWNEIRSLHISKTIRVYTLSTHEGLRKLGCN